MDNQNAHVELFLRKDYDRLNDIDDILKYLLLPTSRRYGNWAFKLSNWLPNEPEVYLLWFLRIQLNLLVYQHPLALNMKHSSHLWNVFDF